MQTSKFPLQAETSESKQIENKLRVLLKPVFIRCLDESMNHKGPSSSGTHMNLLIVSHVFESLSRVKRHQLIYDALEIERSTKLHALCMQCLTPSEWTPDTPGHSSPACAGKPKDKKT